MIPLRDSNPTRTTPVLTYLIIALNVAVFLYQRSLDPESERLFVEQFGLIPTFLAHDPQLGSFITPLTSMFIHGSWLHIIFNMWSLYIFGDNVEDALGKGRFLLFYLVSGCAAAAGQVLVDPSSTLPMIGASGAIAGVLAAYMRLFPNARVLTLIPLIVFFFVREIPAVFFIVFWFGLQVLSGISALHMPATESGGVAVFAHIGGFLAGLLLIRSFVPSRNTTGGFRRPQPFRP
ncbi:MAG TPA: rhomboid family intramembrane serine protease [Polyangiales bacterium]